jgi:hypothetical protein
MADIEVSYEGMEVFAYTYTFEYKTVSLERQEDPCSSTCIVGGERNGTIWSAP